MAEPGADGDPLGPVLNCSKIVDTRVLNSIENFDGTPAKWKSWCWSFENAAANITCGTVSLDEAMRAAVMVPDEQRVRMNVLVTEERQLQCKALFILLSQKCRGRSEIILRAVGRNEGFVAWKRLKQEYEGTESNRCTAMLTGILTPEWAEPCKTRPFLDVL